MKKHLFIWLFIALFSALTKGQDSTNSKFEMKTLMGNKPDHGFYLGIQSGYDRIMNKDAISASAKLAWIVDHNFAFGFIANGFAQEAFIENIYSYNNQAISGGYGGMFLEFIIAPSFPLNISIPLNFGIGTIGTYDNYLNINQDLFYSTSPFLVFEPGIEMQLNFSKYLRLFAGTSYKYSNDIRINQNYSNPFNSFKTYVGIKLGWF